MIKRKYLKITVLAILSTIMLVGCGKNSTQTETQTPIEQVTVTWNNEATTTDTKSTEDTKSETIESTTEVITEAQTQAQEIVNVVSNNTSVDTPNNEVSNNVVTDEKSTEAPVEVVTEAPVKAPNNCPYPLYTPTTRYVENGYGGSKEYPGYYFIMSYSEPTESDLIKKYRADGYKNNMWTSIGNYDDVQRVCFSYWYTK